MNDPKQITITTKVTAENGIETSFAVSGTTEDLAQLMGWRKLILEKFDHSPFVARQNTKTTATTAAPVTNGAPRPAAHPQSSDYKKAPLCKCKEETEIIEGIAKSGKNAGKPYARYVCEKPREFQCGFSQFLNDEQLKAYLADKESRASLDGARDLDAENAALYENLADDDFNF